jgi:predicted DNA-binding WGR domain protein
MQVVYMERCDRRLNMSRFYEVSVEPTLFGDWAVVCRWGRIGTGGRTQQEWFPSLSEAQSAQTAAVADKRERGYDAPST